MRLTGLILSLALLAALSAGCAKPPPEPTLDVQVTVEGDNARVTAATTNLKIGSTHHIHLTLDGGWEIMNDTETYTFHMLAPGEHTVKVDIAGPDHRSIGLVREVRFVVGPQGP